MVGDKGNAKTTKLLEDTEKHLHEFEFWEDILSMNKLLAIIFFKLLFIFGCVGSSFLCEGFLQLRQAGATLHRSARASHYCGLSCCRAQAPDAQAQ